jgi:elongator complex protein 3
MKDNRELAAVAVRVITASIDQGVQTKEALLSLCRRLSKGQSGLPATADLRRAYRRLTAERPELARPALDRLLQRRAVRSISGVAVVTALTKPYPCPGQCVYCPSEARMPKSYLSNEPAAMRALALEFDPWRQVTARLRTLADNGHPNDKIELIVKGGTWTCYPPRYQDWFIKRCFDAANSFDRPRRQAATSLTTAQHANERAGHRIVGLTLETRPDRVTPREAARLRRLGCTRIELGVQALDDGLLTACRRGHDVAMVAKATRLLKEAGFKVDYHLMPQLPESTPKRDRQWLDRVFTDPDFRPDMVKVYPCVVVKSAELYEWWRSGRYRPYSEARLIDLLLDFKQKIPEYCRLSRLVRDIPSTSVEAGNAMTNLRQVVQKRLANQGGRCRCLRCREIGRIRQEYPRAWQWKTDIYDTEYAASGGIEHFLSVEDRRHRAVFAFCRLRLPRQKQGNKAKGLDKDTVQLHKLLPGTARAAFIRELHTYGHLVPIGQRSIQASQHKGLGRKLMKRAETVARRAGFRRMAVIAGVGVRDYYRKLGYRRQGPYMIKRLK